MQASLGGTDGGHKLRPTSREELMLIHQGLCLRTIRCPQTADGRAASLASNSWAAQCTCTMYYRPRPSHSLCGRMHTCRVKWPGWLQPKPSLAATTDHTPPARMALAGREVKRACELQLLACLGRAMVPLRMSISSVATGSLTSPWGMGGELAGHG